MKNITRQEIELTILESIHANIVTFQSKEIAIQNSARELADYVMETFGICECTNQKTINHWWYNTECRKCGTRYK